jgi:hypothetical protein
MVAFATILGVPIFAMESGRGGAVVFILAISAIPICAYLGMALTPIYLAKPQPEIVDVSAIALQARRIGAIPKLLWRIPDSLQATKRLGWALFVIGLVPVVVPIVFVIGVSQLPDATSAMLQVLQSHPVLSELIAVILIIVLNRCLRAGYGLLKLDESCRRVGWQSADWRAATKLNAGTGRNSTVGESALRMGGVVSFMLGITFGGAIGGGAGAFFGLGLMNVVKMMASRRIKRELEGLSKEAVGERPVLYLRAFKDDGALATIDMFSGRTTEEAICLAAAESGERVIALGKPGEKLPPLGANRFYVPDEEWQSVISSWIEKAHQIILAATTTSATKWEKEEIHRKNCVSKLIIVIPLRQKMVITETFQHVKTMTGFELKEPELDEKTKLVGIYFSGDGHPKVIVSTKGEQSDFMEAVKWHKHVLSRAK